MLKNKYYWNTIPLWWLVPAMILIILFNLLVFYKFNDDWIFFGIPSVLILWGIMAGLSYGERDDYFQRLKIIKNSLKLLFIAVALFSILFAIWVVIVDSLENVGFIRQAKRALILSTYFTATIAIAPFIAGLLPAVIVRLFGNKIRRLSD